MTSDRPTVLWIGPSRPDVADGSLVAMANMSVANTWLAEQEAAPELIVIEQARPGEVSHAEVEHLRQLAPFSRLVGLLGTWCEGETRSGHPWPAVERVYWHEWPVWIARELRFLHSDRAATWELPLTATSEERLLATLAQPASEVLPPGRVAICSPRRELAELLVDTFARAGRHAVRIEAMPAADSNIGLAIWDADRLGLAEANQLHAFVEAVRPAPVVVLLTFPRREEIERAVAGGARLVFSKPLLLDDLLAWEHATRYSGAQR